jgi:Fe-S cluster assembly iron-binding protein IscA
MAAPIKQFKENAVRVVVWPGRTDPGDYTYSIEKSYKDKDSGEWKKSTVLFEQDLKSLYMALGQCADWIKETRGSKKQGEEDVGF